MAASYTNFTATSSCPIRFSYVCQHCRQKVTDTAALRATQSIEVRSRDAGKVSQQQLSFDAAEKLGSIGTILVHRLERLYKAVREPDKRKKRKIVRNSLLVANTKLPNKCPYCGKRQGWGHTISRGWGTVLIVLFGLGLAFVLAGSLVMSPDRPPLPEEKVFLPIGLVCLGLSALLFLRCMIAGNRIIDAMTEDTVPKME